jgi:YfiH family protein
MLLKTEKNCYQFKELNDQPEVVHGFSGRFFGDCDVRKDKTNQKNVDRFLSQLGLRGEDLVLMEQVHGGRVKVVGKYDKGGVIPEVDGIITQERTVVLGVVTADCLPILFYDPTEKVVGVIHAGWRGVLRRLPQKMIEVMIRLGSLPENILVGIGPHIGVCCYTIDRERVQKFEQRFGKLPGMINITEKHARLDLTIPVLNQLKHSGILDKKIILSPECTSCLNKDFFSYRRDNEKSFGEMLGVASLN